MHGWLVRADGGADREGPFMAVHGVIIGLPGKLRISVTHVEINIKYSGCICWPIKKAKKIDSHCITRSGTCNSSYSHLFD